MAYEFSKLSEVESLNEVPETATVLAEVEGEIKRIPSSGLGGGGAIKTVIIKDSEYDNTLAGLSAAEAVEPELTYSCLNMTFEEAYEAMAMGEPLDVFGMLSGQGAMNLHGIAMFVGTAMTGVPCIGVLFEFMGDGINLYWTADGLSTEIPA